MSGIITGLTDATPQQILPTLEDGSTLTMTFTYRQQQGGWFYDLSWDGQTPPWQSNGMRLVTGPNILRQYKNQIPFGLTVSTTDGLDPTSVECFDDGSCTLLLLNALDVIDIEELYFVGN